MDAPSNSIIDFHRICHTFAKSSGEPLVVLADIDSALRDGEILGLLGRSGSGKSTFLRIAAGLIKPTSGEVLYRGAPLAGPSEGISVVFQTFALYPWLTVLENVEAGLDALRLPREHLLRFVPLASHIHRVLAEREEHWAPHLRFKAELEDHLTPRDAERTLGAVIGWARYAELFGYDARLRRLKLGTG
jgi:ABC-type nitrate/sulfonate/bicarbonate transport system ATPase subunit